PGYDRFSLMIGGLVSVNNQQVRLRASTNFGASFNAGASDYWTGYGVPAAINSRFWGNTQGDSAEIYAGISDLWHSFQ
ncbi:hypothetical protein ABTA44_21115, partial [Acinetobacter baumannii]